MGLKPVVPLSQQLVSKPEVGGEGEENTTDKPEVFDGKVLKSIIAPAKYIWYGHGATPFIPVDEPYGVKIKGTTINQRHHDTNPANKLKNIKLFHHHHQS